MKAVVVCALLVRRGKALQHCGAALQKASAGGHHSLQSWNAKGILHHVTGSELFHSTESCGKHGWPDTKCTQQVLISLVQWNRMKDTQLSKPKAKASLDNLSWLLIYKPTNNMNFPLLRSQTLALLASRVGEICSEQSTTTVFFTRETPPFIWARSFLKS